jgi:hypothetical protein
MHEISALQAPARTHSSCNPRRPSASPKIEKSACDQSNPLHPSRGACGHLYVAELERPSLCRIETPRRRLCHAYSGSACDPATVAHWAKGSSEQPSITRSILLICNDCGSSSFRGRMICLLAIFHVSLPPCDPFSQCRRFVFAPYDAQQELRCCHCHADCHLPQPWLAEIGPSRHRSAQTKAYNACRRLHRTKGAHRDPSPDA